MTYTFDAILTFVAILAGAIASVSGFGVGSLLTPTLALQAGTKAAVAAVAIRSAPKSRDELQSPTWQVNSRCYQLLRSAAARADALETRVPGRLDDLKETAAFWLSDFPNLAARTRSIIVSSFTSKAASLLRAPVRRLLCSGTSPEACPSATHGGKVVVLNFPVKQFGEVGRFAQVVHKTVWQRATERSSLSVDWRPVFLWADEAQNFVTSEDMLFQRTPAHSGRPRFISRKTSRTTTRHSAAETHGHYARDLRVTGPPSPLAAAYGDSCPSMDVQGLPALSATYRGAARRAGA